jgi:hypothetical protein
MFNHHSQSPFGQERQSGRRYAGEWLDIPLPLFMGGDHVAMPVPGAKRYQRLRHLKIDGRFRRSHACCDLADAGSINRMRGVIVKREARPLQAISRAEKLDHIWSTAGADFRTYADQRFATGQEIPTPVQLSGRASLRSRRSAGLRWTTAVSASCGTAVTIRQC